MNTEYTQFYWTLGWNRLPVKQTIAFVRMKLFAILKYEIPQFRTCLRIPAWLMTCLVLCHFHYWVRGSGQPNEVKLLAMWSAGIKRKLLRLPLRFSDLQCGAAFQPNSSSSVAVHIYIYAPLPPRINLKLKIIHLTLSWKWKRKKSLDEL